jgi:DDE superfamily endonuclease
MEFMSMMIAFAPLFSQRVWPQALTLVMGALLAPGKRTVSQVLRVMGLADEPQFQRYHRVLNRAVWSSQQASRRLLALLVSTFAADGVIVMGLDDTIERRWGKRIAARGIYRDPVRSSQDQFVKTSGLRWLSLMLLVPIPWAQRVWALPFLTVLAPSERYNQTQERRHKALTDWARQMLVQVRRWLGNRPIVVVADSSFAALEFLGSVSHLPNPVHVVTRLRLDAALYEPAPPRDSHTIGCPRKVGPRSPTLKTRLEDATTRWQALTLGHQTYTVEWVSQTAVWYHTGLSPVPIRWVLVRDPLGKLAPQAFLCTNLEATPAQIVQWFRQRWQVEVTFQEVRAHLGVETQRQWANSAILRTTPALLALFSLVVLLTQQLHPQFTFSLPQTAWYTKQRPTFADALAFVRRYLWASRLFQTSRDDVEYVKVPRPIFDTWTELLCHAA